jgi:hypothetical protein
MNKQVSCITGCYQLHLYCANLCRTPNRADEYTGPTKGYCYREARKDGWIINDKANHGLCPKCSGKKGKR